jgi:hypothetical protein
MLILRDGIMIDGIALSSNASYQELQVSSVINHKKNTHFQQWVEPIPLPTVHGRDATNRRLNG